MTARTERELPRELKRCREVLLLMRQQETTLIHLMSVRPSSPVEQVSLQRQIDGLNALLEGSREQYRRFVVQSMRLLSRLSGRDYDALCMYYVIGMSLTEISVNLHVTVRTVSRIKARGLRRLGQIIV